MNSLNTLNYIYHNRLWNSISSLASYDYKTDCSSTMRFLHHNVKSLTKKHYFYKSLNLQHSCDIFSVSETWLKPCIPNSLVSLHGFNLIRHDRDSVIKTRAGGAAIYIRSDIKYSILVKPSSILSDVCDSVWLKIKTTSKTECLIIASIYLPPDPKLKPIFLEKLAKSLVYHSLLGKD